MPQYRGINGRQFALYNRATCMHEFGKISILSTALVMLAQAGDNLSVEYEFDKFTFAMHLARDCASMGDDRAALDYCDEAASYFNETTLAKYVDFKMSVARLVE